MKKRKRTSFLNLLCARFTDIPRKDLHARILCGELLVNGECIKDPSYPVSEESVLAFMEDRYVSRGGIKLEHALETFSVDVRDLVMIDAGSSTGGFTDCLLSRGAGFVHAIDVGYNQLDYSLRRHESVGVLERTNVMSLEPGSLVPPPDAAVCDLSFRSVEGAASRLVSLVKYGWLIALVKPQFELREPGIDFDGIVRDRDTLLAILFDIESRLRDESVFVSALTESPIRGNRGNREVFFLLKAVEEVPRSNVLSAIGNLYRDDW